MPNRIEARSAKAALTNATGRLPLLRLFSTPLIDLHCLLSVTKRHFLFNDSSNVPTFESVLEFARASPLKPSPRSLNGRSNEYNKNH